MSVDDVSAAPVERVPLWVRELEQLLPEARERAEAEIDRIGDLKGEAFAYWAICVISEASTCAGWAIERQAMWPVCSWLYDECTRRDIERGRTPGRLYDSLWNACWGEGI